MSNPVSLPVLITTLSTKVDGSIKIVLETRELDGKDSARLFDMRGSEAWAIISPSELKDDEVHIPTERPDPDVSTKTPSKRLRDRMFVFYEKVVHGDRADFDMWYVRELDRIGQRYLEKVDHDA